MPYRPRKNHTEKLLWIALLASIITIWKGAEKLDTLSKELEQTRAGFAKMKKNIQDANTLADQMNIKYLNGGKLK